MSTKTASKSTESSWWNERGSIRSMRAETARPETTRPETERPGTKRTETKTAKPRPKRKVKTRKASKAETGQTYYCEVCGCEMVCASESAGEVICCEEPMCVVV